VEEICLFYEMSYIISEIKERKKKKEVRSKWIMFEVRAIIMLSTPTNSDLFKKKII
jgi:hypothetical protein